ncbi:2-isopropylmalate synthase [Moorena producens JHB]|uniref:2-isopropylmalate synthase n=1 Tax=Moorena producens (strain JHB) TaxID=1454205 RepID=A0A1D9FTM3_MOOP1|nr:2-isopropylmalate synthase [Moorena producens]AOY78719.1 2-isopropylmalate synthase [Moorena producens JHB]
MLQILDSTLREGEQTPGVYFSPETKLLIAQLLDRIGIDIIEVGNPAVDPEICEAVALVSNAGLNAKIGAHSLCRIDHVQKALDCKIDFLGIFLSVANHRLERDYQITIENAIEQVVEVIGYAKAQNPNLLIRYTPEDTTRTSIEQVIEVASAAVQAGADIISIADTTGYATPFKNDRSYSYFVKTLKEKLAGQQLYPKIAVHCHNDRGLALANALDAYQAGADIIDVTVMGLGERAGIVDLATLLVNLGEMVESKLPWEFNYLKDLYHIVSEYSHISIPPILPIMGKNAFTHYAGVHVKAIAKDPMLYQSLALASLTNKNNLALGMQSGRASVELALEQIGQEGVTNNRVLMNCILNEVKVLAKRGTGIDIDNELPHIVNQCFAFDNCE